MICKANGVPEPTYSWTKGDSQSLFAKGAMLYIANTSYSDAGKYKCTASNEMGKDTKERKLVVQSKYKKFASLSTWVNILTLDRVGEYFCLIDPR